MDNQLPTYKKKMTYYLAMIYDSILELCTNIGYQLI